MSMARVAGCSEAAVIPGPSTSADPDMVGTALARLAVDLEGLEELEQGAHPKAGAALSQLVALLLGVGGPGDVEMRPGSLVHELLEEQTGDEGARLARLAHVLHVRDVRVDVLSVLPGEREPPERLAGACGRRLEGADDPRVVAHEARHLAAERDDAGARQRGEVDDGVRVALGGEDEAVGEDEAAFGVGVEDLDRLPVPRP